MNRGGRGVDWAWGLLVCFMWGVCGVGWAAMDVRGSDDPLGEMRFRLWTAASYNTSSTPFGFGIHVFNGVRGILNRIK